MFINKCKSVGSKQCSYPKAFIEYSLDMDVIYEIIDDYNPNKKRKIFIVFDDMIADILGYEKRNPVVIELFVRGWKLNISLVCTTKSYFAVPKNID